jgi:pimeloyl-ACP methyl ester carboxylesterase
MTTPSQNPGLGLFGDAMAYGIDAVQRSILFADVLRKRGNIFLEGVQKGQRPVLTFDYEILMDGRSLERPVNHDLARIVPKSGIAIQNDKRPVVVADPRAGHGPGIGGSKPDSAIGMALRNGHAVYIILFYPDPEAGQTYADVKAAQTRFVEAVRERHPNAPEPLVIGNCQGGWAMALLSADRPDITGPVVMNGSPLSYWAGMDGKTPMRYRGGLIGGIWLTSMLSDLGNGKFDGAHLVMNFEDLNPANTYWTKQYNVWANVDNEAERYLNFERWWNAYFTMTAEEIHFIVRNLFVGNRLERGEIELDEGHKINLKNMDDPLVVFASTGDNITPPQQALNWIAKVYGSVGEIRRCGQVIVYRVHEKVGHLGIFVSGGVAKKEHKEIIENIERIDNLPPGLYEMVIEETERTLEDGVVLPDFNVKFVERDMTDILALDDGFENEREFKPVAVVSEFNDKLYRNWLAPAVRLMTTPASAEALKWAHPMRASRYAFADVNPGMWPVNSMAEAVRKQRKPVDSDNPFVQAQEAVSKSIIALLDGYRDMRDTTQEFLFKSLYGNKVIRALCDEEAEQELTHEEMESREHAIREDIFRWLSLVEEGGALEGLLRVAVAAAGADRVYDEREFRAIVETLMADPDVATRSRDQLKRLAKVQARILQAVPMQAIEALPRLLPKKADRQKAVDLADKIIRADDVIEESEARFMKVLKRELELE